MSSLMRFLRDNNIITKTIEVDDDVEFGSCDASGLDGNVVSCYAKTYDGDSIHFELSEELIDHLNHLLMDI